MFARRKVNNAKQLQELASEYQKHEEASRVLNEGRVSSGKAGDTLIGTQEEIKAAQLVAQQQLPLINAIKDTTAAVKSQAKAKPDGYWQYKALMESNKPHGAKEIKEAYPKIKDALRRLEASGQKERYTTLLERYKNVIEQVEKPAAEKAQLQKIADSDLPSTLKRDVDVALVKQKAADSLEGVQGKQAAAVRGQATKGRRKAIQEADKAEAAAAAPSVPAKAKLDQDGEGIWRRRRNPTSDVQPLRGPGHKFKMKGSRFGSLRIDLQQLARMVLHAYDEKGRMVIQKRVDPTFVDLITKRFNAQPNFYTPIAVQAFRELVEKSGVDIEGEDSKKKTLLYHNSKGGCLPINMTKEDGIRNLQVLIGEIHAGNTNPAIKNRLSDLITFLLNEKVISRKEATSLFKDYVAQ